MRAIKKPCKAVLTRFLAALIVVSFQFVGLSSISPALAAVTPISDDGSNGSGWTGEVSLAPTSGNPGSAFSFGKNTLMGKPFGTSGADFSDSTIEFQAYFVDGKDHLAVFWGDGVNQTSSISNSLYIGPGGNPGSGAAMAGQIGISINHSRPHIYWHGVDGGVSGTGSPSVTSGLWEINRWYDIKIEIGASSTSYYVNGVLIQTKATPLPTANVITLGGDDRNGWGFSNGVFVDNIAITPAAPPLAVNYDLNLGSGSAPTASVQPGASFTTAAAPTRSGYTFTVWRSGASDAPASTSFTANRGYTMGSTDITLTAQWSPLSNTVTFDSQNWQTAATIQTLTGSSSTLPTAPTWYGYNFKGWSEASSGAVVDVSTVTIAGAKTFYAIWEQKSLAGLTGLPSPDVINPHATQARTITSSLGDTSTAVKVPGGALPTTFQVKVYTLPDDSFADEKLGAGTYIISQVVAWADTAAGSVGNIQDTAAGKPIEMTITSPDIKAGAKVYSVLGDSSTLLATATQNGSVTVTFSEDPVIIVEAAPAVNSAPGGSSPDPVVIKPVVKPTKPVANTPKGINFAGFNPNSWTLTKAIKASIDRFFKKVASPTKVSCVGNTMGPKVLKGYQEIAARRGQVVCDYIANNFAETAEIVISGVPTKFADTRYRRARVGLTY